METQTATNFEDPPAKYIDSDANSASDGSSEVDDANAESTSVAIKRAPSLSTMEKGAVLTPELKRQRIFQDLWFILGGLAAGLFGALNGLLPVYLGQSYGLGPNQIAIATGVTRVATLVRLPAAILSDRYDFRGLGHRRPWIFLGFVVGAIFYAALAILEAVEFTFGGFVVLLFIANAASEVWDNTLDGYTVDVTPKWRVGYVQGTLLNGSRGAGLIIGTLLFSQIGDTSGWVAVFAVCAIFSFLPSIAVFVLPEPKERSTFQLQAALAEFKRKEIVAHALYAFWSGTLFSIKGIVVAQYFLFIGSNLAEYGIYSTVSGIAFLVGALLFGWLMDKMRKHIAGVFYLIMALNWFATFLYIIVATRDNPYAYIYIFWPFMIIGGASVGGTIATNMALVMLEIRDEGVAASFYAVFAMMTVLGFAVGGFLTGPLLTNLGFLGTGIFVAASVAPNFVLIFIMFHGLDYTHKATGDESAEANVELGDLVDDEGADSSSSSSNDGAPAKANDEGDASEAEDSLGSSSRSGPSDPSSTSA